ncbi:Pao retrotransposon peptidase [Trichuris suis]|nr:Pao retrotransposon peptidase [Trichuris suis]
MRKGSYTLAKWVSNSGEINDVTQQTEAWKEIGTVLGLTWNRWKDTLIVKLPAVNASSMDTERQVLKTVASLIDPLGLVAPFAVVAKVLLQKLWLKGIDWDDLIPKDVASVWTGWKRECAASFAVEIERSMKLVPDGKEMQLDLHTFCDASETAYGAVVYVKAEKASGEQFVNIVMAKTRVAPVKRVTLPRLELLAALLGARLTLFVKDQLKLTIRKAYCWTDSEVVLSWIKGNPSGWKPFVRNRVEEILQTTEPSQWRYCPTGQNPADLASRGCSIKKVSVWWHGPSWLMEDEHGWPVRNIKRITTEEKQSVKRLVVQIASQEEERFSLAERYGRFVHLVRVTATCLRFADNCRYIQQHRRFGPVTSTELRKAEKVWFRIAQQEAFTRELVLSGSQERLPASTKLIHLDPFPGF